MSGELEQTTECDVASMAKRLKEAGHRIDPVLEELFPPETDRYLRESFWHHMAGGGKRLRPALCVLSCKALGGDESDVLYFAAAVEILHNMFLVHDDIEDGDHIRRDQPTVWAEYGIGNGINVGDFMLGRAFRAVLKTPADEATCLRLMDEFVTTYDYTCQGQAFDLNRRGDEDLTVEDYLEMVTRKTGHYLTLGMVGGAIIAGAPEEAVDAFHELGRNMGPAFQIRDDVLDLEASKGRGGDVGNDIREGKPSILFAHSIKNAEPDDRATLLEIMRRDRDDTSDDDVETVVEIYESCGAFEFARQKSQELTERGFETVERIPTEEKDFFRNVVTYMAERSS